VFMGFSSEVVGFSGYFLGFLEFFGVLGILMEVFRKVHGIILGNLPHEKSCFPCSSILQYYIGGNVFFRGIKD